LQTGGTTAVAIDTAQIVTLSKSLALLGSTSGSVTIAAPAVAGSTTITLPATSGTLLQSGTAVTVAQGGTGLTAGTSGGIPYFSSTSAITSSAALTANGVVYGGGAGAAPVATAAGTTGQFLGANTGAAPTWQTPAGGSPGGSDTYVQYNSGGTTFAGSANLTFNGSNLSVGPAITTNTSNLLIGTSTAGAGLGYATRLAVDSSVYDCTVLKNSAGPGGTTLHVWNAGTVGNNSFQVFYTEGGAGTVRGSITYNRAGGLTAYNTTSDYRAKDIIGPVVNSGELIDSVPVYMGKMKGATQERPMFIAHETPDFAHTGEKDAVNENGEPIYQQMDVSALVPVLWAEVKSLRARIAALEAK
jgi:hypothetical protein